MNDILTSIGVLGIVALLAAVILYAVSRRFSIDEDPRLGLIQKALPGANCGGCGFAGCSGMAAALLEASATGDLGTLSCPVGGEAVMAEISGILGVSSSISAPRVAVIRCSGSLEVRPLTLEYDGWRSCKAIHATGSGETGCGYGCLGAGDCVAVCQFDALRINVSTKLPEVDEERCTGCGQCASVCPRHVVELRPKGSKGRRIYVGCINRDRGSVAKNICKVACLGCGKCQASCPFGAISIDMNVAYIDPDKCRMCRKCEAVCPTGAVKALNFPPRKTHAETVQQKEESL